MDVSKKRLVNLQLLRNRNMTLVPINVHTNILVMTLDWQTKEKLSESWWQIVDRERH